MRAGASATGIAVSIGLALAACGRVGYDVSRAAPDGAARLDAGAGDAGAIDASAPTGEAVGELDPDFGTSGVATASYDDLRDEKVFSITRASGGAGWATLGTIYFGSGFAGFELIRWTDAGQLEPTFAERGFAFARPAPGYDYGYGIATLSAGDYAVIGDGAFGGPDDFVVMRMLPSGAVDSRFGAGGLVRIDFGSGDTSVAIAEASGDRVVACGTADYESANSRIGLARLGPTGARDPTFASTGQVALDPSPGADVCKAIVVGDDDSVLVVGSSSGRMFVARVTAAGALDPTFASGGVYVHADAGYGADLALRADGRLVAAGGSAGRVLLVGLTAGGVLDAAFGTGGVVTDGLGLASAGANAVVLQADGKIVVAGNATPAGGTADVLVARRLANGAPDAAFAGSGYLVVDPFGTADDVWDVGLDPRGGIVAAGSSGRGGRTKPVLVRVR